MNNALSLTIEEFDETTAIASEDDEAVEERDEVLSEPSDEDAAGAPDDVNNTDIGGVCEDAGADEDGLDVEPGADEVETQVKKVDAGEEHHREYKEVTEEELDEIADTTIEALRVILKYFNAGEAEIDEYEGEDGELIMDIVGDNLALLIGRHGKTLDSLQFLVSAIVSKKIGYRYPVVIDVEGYKQRRKQKLISLAKSSAARALRQKNEVRLRPMNPYERRIVHITLRADNRIQTLSEGIDPNRYIVIRPK